MLPSFCDLAPDFWVALAGLVSSSLFSLVALIIAKKSLKEAETVTENAEKKDAILDLCKPLILLQSDITRLLDGHLDSFKVIEDVDFSAVKSIQSVKIVAYLLGHGELYDLLEEDSLGIIERYGAFIDEYISVRRLINSEKLLGDPKIAAWLEAKHTEAAKIQHDLAKAIDKLKLPQKDLK